MIPGLYLLLLLHSIEKFIFTVEDSGISGKNLLALSRSIVILNFTASDSGISGEYLSSEDEMKDAVVKMLIGRTRVRTLS